MTDRELLELAAKAAGIDGKFSDGIFWRGNSVDGVKGFWNPLADDGELHRLMRAVKGNLYLIDCAEILPVQGEDE